MTSEIPSFHFESEFWAEGYSCVAGVDEVGRGALAGPVVAAAVIVEPSAVSVPKWYELRDSKLLKAQERESYAGWIQDNAHAWAIGEASSTVIDQVNIAEATKQAMQQAIAKLQPPPDSLLIDWVKLPSITLPQKSLKKADLRIISVAAASIIAKVYRDGLMAEMDAIYPQFDFANNKGYGTKRHRERILADGPCPIHRRTFAPMSKMNESHSGEGASVANSK